MEFNDRTPAKDKYLQSLLTRDHSLNGGILFGLDGRMVEIQARATNVRRVGCNWCTAVTLGGMAMHFHLIARSPKPVVGKLMGFFAIHERTRP